MLHQKFDPCLKIRDQTTIPLVNGNVHTYLYIYIYTWYLIYIFIKTHSNCWRLGCWQKPQSFPTFNPVTAFESGLHPFVLKRCLGETCDPGFKPMGPKPVGIHPLTRKHVRKRSRDLPSIFRCQHLWVSGKNTDFQILPFFFTERPWSILKQIVPTLCVREDLNLSKCLFFRSFTGTHFRLPLPPPLDWCSYRFADFFGGWKLQVPKIFPKCLEIRKSADLLWLESFF